MNKRFQRTLAMESVGVKKIRTDSLEANPYNPRMLFDRAPLDILKKSIFKVGILVPLTVYWSKNKNRYIILDGQRRWMCAEELGLVEVPVNQVAEPSTVQNIVMMFQIHKLRADWELMPTALKIEVLMSEMQERNEKALASLCGLDQAVVVRCKKLLSFPKKYQDLMLDPDPHKRVKADFFIELYTITNDRFVNRLDWYSKDHFTQRMLEKYQRGNAGLKAVTDFRIMKQYINNARKANKHDLIARRLREFCEDDSLPLDHLKIHAADVSASGRRLLAEVKKIEATISEIDVEKFYGQEELWLGLERLLHAIRTKLQAAGRRLKE